MIKLFVWPSEICESDDDIPDGAVRIAYYEELARLRGEKARLLTLISDAQYELRRSRIWGGTYWYYNQLRGEWVQKAHDILSRARQECEHT